jgi:hypothetical protein
MKQQEKVVILDPGGTLMHAPLLGFEEAGNLVPFMRALPAWLFSNAIRSGPDLPDPLKRLYLEDPARKKAAAMYRAQNPEFKEKQIHQKVDVLDTRKINDGAGQSYEAVTVRAEGNLIRTGTVNKMEFREPVKFQTEFLFIRNPDLLGNRRLPLVVQESGIRKSLCKREESLGKNLLRFGPQVFNRRRLSARNLESVERLLKPANDALAQYFADMARIVQHN